MISFVTVSLAKMARSVKYVSKPFMNLVIVYIPFFYLPESLLFGLCNIMVKTNIRFDLHFYVMCTVKDRQQSIMAVFVFL